VFGCVGEGLQGLTFQTKSPPLQPMDIMPYIYSHASEGDAEAVIKAIDEFGEFYPMCVLILHRTRSEENPRVLCWGLCYPG
jgi:hypothetical protein